MNNYIISQRATAGALATRGCKSSCTLLTDSNGARGIRERQPQYSCGEAY